MLDFMKFICENKDSHEYEEPNNVRRASANFFIDSKDSFIHAYELLLGLHVFRQTGPPRRVDCLAPPSVCHIKMEASR